jgi:hypothetical protein
MKALLLGTLTLRTATGTTGALLIVWNKYLNSTGSISSLKALAVSRPTMNSSKRSTRPGLLRWALAKGEFSTG